MSPLAYIGFGSNLGDRKTKFHEAVRSLAQLPKTCVKAKSRLYETDPVGITDHGPKFLNAVILIDTELLPRELIEGMRVIELELGKSIFHRSDKSRLIDLDLLLYENRHVREEGFEIPHPRMHQRAFVLVPLAELDPTILIPTLGCTVTDLIRTLPEKEIAGVKPLNNGDDPDEHHVT
jgi:2-amino-4-hydroxy-6-hydroxymethyldihydropteridine diphosphokinase